MHPLPPVMISSSLSLHSAVGLLALVLLSGVCRSRAGTEASSSALTLNGATQSNVTLIVDKANGLTFTNTAQGGIVAIVNQNGGSTTYSTLTPGLFGNVDDLQFKTTKSGETRAKAGVLLINTSATSLRNVTATVYLSDDNTLSADDTKIVTLDLSDYDAKGKVGKHSTVSLPFNYKVPSVLKSYLNGKYLIIVLSADNLGTIATTPIVVGPITLP